VRLYRANDGQAVGKLSGSLQTLAFRGDGKVLAGADTDGQLHLWDGEGRKLLASWPAGQGSVGALDFLEGGLLASVGRDVRLWQADRRRLVLILPRSGDQVRDLAASGGGKRLIVVEAQSALVWDVDQLRQALAKKNLGW